MAEREVIAVGRIFELPCEIAIRVLGEPTSWRNPLAKRFTRATDRLRHQRQREQMHSGEQGAAAQPMNLVVERAILGRHGDFGVVVDTRG